MGAPLNVETGYSLEVETWRRSMDENLRRRDGWLALAGLHWLSPGTTRLGSDPACDLVLPASSPLRLGTLAVEAGAAYLRVEPEVADRVAGLPLAGAPLAPDSSDRPDRILVGELTLVLIERGRRLGLRVWDNARPDRQDFGGRRWFPIDPSWRFRARFEPARTGLTVRVPNVLGDVIEEPDLGLARFRIGDREFGLRAVPAGEDSLWFLFEDQTNGDSTYPAGRFLKAEPPTDGFTLLDFNRAYNPPCAFTAFATCPLPPRGNRLPLAVPAGERFDHAP